MGSNAFTWQDLAIPADKKVAINDNGRVVLERRYFAKNEKGERVEDAHGRFSRIA